MTDHIAAVRAQAEKEHSKRFGSVKVTSGAHLWLLDSQFAEGAAWLASRLTRESIAEELSKHHFIHGIGRSNSCHCGVQAGEFAEYRNHEADAILALFTEDLRAVDQ